MKTLEKKVILVTGASKGIGAAVARQLASEGASLAINYVSDKAGADALVAELSAGGTEIMAIQGDVSKPGDVKKNV